MKAERFGDLAANLHDRVEGGHRVLKDHRYGPATDLLPELLLRHQTEVAAFEEHLAVGRGDCGLGRQAQDGPDEDGLPRP